MTLDIASLQNEFGDRFQVFLGAHSSGIFSGIWQRPRGATMAEIICIGGGAGGGGGFGSTAGNSRGGGGGGGGSAVTRLITPLIHLPDRLYVSVGAGGLGVTTGTGGSGELSYVSIEPGTLGGSKTNILITSGQGGPTGGVSSTSGTGGAAGGAGTIAVVADSPLCGQGDFISIAGQAGVAGSSGNADGTSVTLPGTSVLVTGGAGGAGCLSTDRAGGDFTGSAGTLIGDVAPQQTNAGQSAGASLQLWRPFFSFGGLGAGSSNTTVGPNGGPGTYGAGGGGGGAGVTTGGRGGNGGNGIVIFICW